jgi:hypothetical protein
MTTETIIEAMKLPHSTAECDLGPEIQMRRPGGLTIRYDAEGESGPVWTTVRFRGAVALRILPEVAVTALAAAAYSRVGIVKNSTWLASLRAPAADGALSAELQHFVIFFDHYGSVETIARSCELES